MLGAACREHRQIALGKAGLGVLVYRIERVDQAIAERIGVDIERRMNEVRDIHPEILVARPNLDRRTKALALDAEPDFADALGGQFAIAPLGVDGALEGIEGDLPNDGVDHVFDLPASRAWRCLRFPVSASNRLNVSISPNTLAVSASVSGVGAINGPFLAAST